MSFTPRGWVLLRTGVAVYHERCGDGEVTCVASVLPDRELDKVRDDVEQLNGHVLDWTTWKGHDEVSWERVEIAAVPSVVRTAFGRYLGESSSEIIDTRTAYSWCSTPDLPETDE